VYRPDLYQIAAEDLITEGKLTASEFPAFASETGFRPPLSDFIDHITYDGQKPNAYIDSFPIGLKGKETVK